MRVKNSLKNILISILTQLIIILLGFLSRKVFLDSLGTEYLGINGLLTNVLSMLSLVEGGIGTSITYNLYKPLAEKNEEKVIALIQLYKKIYLILAIIIFVISIVLYPLFSIIANNGGKIYGLFWVYLIFIIKNMLSYLNAHKWSLINADQKGYILGKYNIIFNIVTTFSKIIILKLTGNYILFLLIEMFLFMIQNIWNGRIVNYNYPYISIKKRYTVDIEIKENLKKNVKALFLHNVGRYCVFGTDNLLIAFLINVKVVGLYSNYTMIVGQLDGLITSILYGISNSVGNLIAIEKKEKLFNIFNTIYLVNFWIYSISSIFLFNLVEPFLEWWLGSNFLLDRETLFIIIINFYITGLRVSVNIFKSKSGIFFEDRYLPVMEALINLCASFILAQYFGLAGIFIGTTLSTLLVPFWTQSKLVYNKVFDKSSWEYFAKYIKYVGLTLIVGSITTIICNQINLSYSFISLVVKGIICVLIPNLVYLMLFWKVEEFEYLKNIANNILLSKVKRRKGINNGI